MPYLGNDLQVAQPSYRNIDDISGSFNSSTTSFPLLVSGAAPVPFPINSNQCLISVAGVVQRPDDSGTEGFRISGGNIIFSSAPSTGADFFGVILAGADYVNVGANFPSGSAAVPSITFDSDLDTGIYNSAANQVSITTAGTERLRIDSAGQIEAVSLGTAAAPSFSFTTDPNTGIYSPGADQVAISTNGTGRLFIDASGNVKVNNDFSGAILSTFTGNFNILSGSSTTHSACVLAWDHRNLTTNIEQRIQSVFGDDATVDNYKNAGYIAFGKEGTWQGDSVRDSYIAFATTDAATQSEKLRITSDGKVGIGTTSPSLGLLQVSSTDGVTLAIKNTSPTVVGNEFCQLTFNNTDNSTSGNFESAKIKAISTNGGVNLAHLTFENSGTERARIDSSGRLLVGTSTARANFFNSTFTSQVQVEGTTNDTASAALIRSSTDNGGTVLYFAKQRGSIGANGLVSSGDKIATLSFQASDGSEFVEAASIVAEVDGTPGADDMPGRLMFSVTRDGASSPTEAIRITNDGRSNFFADSNVVQMVATTKAASVADYIFIGRHSSTGYNTGTSCFLVRSNGDVENTNNSYGAISDAKLKENIVDAGSQWADLKALQVRKYNLKEGQTHTQIGLVAQEVELVSPGLVSESPDRDAEGNDLGTVTKSVNYSVLYMKAVKALQEAMGRIETLEAKVAALEAS